MKPKYIKYGKAWGNCDILPYGKFQDRFRHLYVLGKTQSGKSTLFLNLIKQHLDYGMVVVDPAGEMSRDVAGMVEDKNRVMYVDINNPIVINPLTRYNNWGMAAKELMHIINNAIIYTTATERFTVLMRELVRNAIRIFKEEEHKNLKYLYEFLTYPWVRSILLAGGDDGYWSALSYMYTDPETGKQKVDQRKFQEFREKRDSAKRAATRMSEFFDTPEMAGFIIGKDQYNLKEIAEQKKIVCFNFHGFDPDEIIFLGNLITHPIMTYYQRFASTKSPHLFVFIDEFHLFMSEAFAKILVECGKFNVSMNLSHHYHEQLSKKILDSAVGSCHTKIVFSCGYNEAYRMCREYRNNIDDFFNLGQYEALLQIGNKVCHIKTFPPPEIPELFEPEKKVKIKAKKKKDYWIYDGEKYPLRECVVTEPIPNDWFDGLAGNGKI